MSNKQTQGTEGESSHSTQELIAILTADKNWSYEAFRDIMILLANFDLYTPNKPDSINISGIRQRINHLIGLANEPSSRYVDRYIVQTFFVDTEIDKLLLSSKIRAGQENRVEPNWTSAKGRERYQKHAMCIYVRPFGFEALLRGGFGLTTREYTAFLADQEQQAIVLVFGDTILLALKSSKTPRHLSRKAAEELTAGILERHIQVSSPKTYMEKLLAFHSDVCIATNLSLYLATEGSENILRKIV